MCFRVVKLHLAVTCELCLELLQILEGVFGPFVSVQLRVAALEKDAEFGVLSDSGGRCQADRVNQKPVGSDTGQKC